MTDLAATMDPAGTLRVDVTAVDQLAELENRSVGDVPWPAETLPPVSITCWPTPA